MGESGALSGCLQAVAARGAEHGNEIRWSNATRVATGDRAARRCSTGGCGRPNALFVPRRKAVTCANGFGLTTLIRQICRAEAWRSRSLGRRKKGRGLRATTRISGEIDVGHRARPPGTHARSATVGTLRRHQEQAGSRTVDNDSGARLITRSGRAAAGAPNGTPALNFLGAGAEPFRPSLSSSNGRRSAHPDASRHPSQACCRGTAADSV